MKQPIFIAFLLHASFFGLSADHNASWDPFAPAKQRQTMLKVGCVLTACALIADQICLKHFNQEPRKKAEASKKELYSDNDKSKQKQTCCPFTNPLTWNKRKNKLTKGLGILNGTALAALAGMAIENNYHYNTLMQHLIDKIYNKSPNHQERAQTAVHLLNQNYPDRIDESDRQACVQSITQSLPKTFDQINYGKRKLSNSELSNADKNTLFKQIVCGNESSTTGAVYAELVDFPNEHEITTHNINEIVHFCLTDLDAYANRIFDIIKDQYTPPTTK